MRAVAGIHDSVIWQREELGLYALHELAHRAAGEIGAADAVAEEHITAEKEVLRLPEEANAVRRVAGDMEQLPGDPAGLHRAFAFEKLIHLERHDGHRSPCYGSEKAFQGQIR
ncbi:MAG: hypothetical protein RIS79_2717 [Verrucomicrobiota bacterium]